MTKKVLFIGFSSIQTELAKKLMAFRKLGDRIEPLSEQRSGEAVDAYVLNADHQGGDQRLALYARLHAAPVMCVGLQHLAQADVYVPGSFKLQTVDALWELLTQGVQVASASSARSAGAAVKTVAAAAPPVVGAQRGAEAQVLVVDDSEVVRRSMVRKLADYGQAVHLANSGEDALAMLPGSQYKLIFLDVMMAGLDGLEVCKRIKRSPEYKKSSVYMLTSKDGMFDKVRANMAGCDGYLVKPLESSKLREVLDKFFERPSGLPNSSMMSGIWSATHLNDAERKFLAGAPPKDMPAYNTSPADLFALKAAPTPKAPAAIAPPAATAPPIPFVPPAPIRPPVAAPATPTELAALWAAPPAVRPTPAPAPAPTPSPAPSRAPSPTASPAEAPSRVAAKLAPDLPARQGPDTMAPTQINRPAFARTQVDIPIDFPADTRY